MRLAFNFTLTAETRRRRDEISFYRQLGGAVLMSVLVVMALAWRIDAHAEAILDDNLALEAALQEARPKAALADHARRRIDAMRLRLSVSQAHAVRRGHAARLLRAMAIEAPADVRLHRLSLLPHRIELNGHARRAQDVQAFGDALRQTGLEQLAIKELRLAQSTAGTDAAGQYDFLFSAPDNGPATIGERGEATP